MRECANAFPGKFSRRQCQLVDHAFARCRAYLLGNLLKVLGDGLPVGPVLVGAAQPAHVMTASVTARGLVNMTALAVIEAQAAKAKGNWDDDRGASERYGRD